jgi:glucan phosphorylase
VRDMLSQRWFLTENTYARKNPKRTYYLAMEFLIGRSVSKNVTKPTKWGRGGPNTFGAVLM